MNTIIIIIMIIIIIIIIIIKTPQWYHGNHYLPPNIHIFSFASTDQILVGQMVTQ